MPAIALALIPTVAWVAVCAWLESRHRRGLIRNARYNRILRFEAAVLPALVFVPLVVVIQGVGPFLTLRGLAWILGIVIVAGVHMSTIGIEIGMSRSAANEMWERTKAAVQRERDERRRLQADIRKKGRLAHLRRVHERNR